MSPPQRFSIFRTPIYGVTKGDEYYPVVSMAGNIAYITSTVQGMMYPHPVTDLPRMTTDELNEFYAEYSSRVGTPKSLKRVLFVGGIPQDLKYCVPYILHSKSNYNLIFEPFGLEWKYGGTMKSFYRSFGRYIQNDLLVIGHANQAKDKEIVKECESLGLERKNATEFLQDYTEFGQKLIAEAHNSNLSKDQTEKIQKVVERSTNIVRNS